MTKIKLTWNVLISTLKNKFDSCIEKYGRVIYYIALIPTALIIMLVFSIIGISNSITLCFQLPFLAIQIICCVIYVKYNKF